MRGDPSRWNYETRLIAGTMLATAPALIALLVALLVALDDGWRVAWIWSSVALITLAFAFAARRRAVYPLNTLANLLEALREGDYSLRGSRARRGDAIGEVVIEINALSQTLREQRLGFEEKSALLGKVIAALDIAVIAFDEKRALRLANPAAERLLGAQFAALEGRAADELGLGDWLDLADAQLIERSFPGGSGRWEVR